MTAHPEGVKERPILFSGPMVRAILDGRKTQTRRVVKLPKYATPENAVPWSFAQENAIRAFTQEYGGQSLLCNLIGDLGVHNQLCPYGQPGDRLWVRETFFETRNVSRDSHKRKRGAVYRADEGVKFGRFDNATWRSPIHMPRWASRLTMEITEVSVQRVQEIGVDDARAEGVDHDTSETSDGPRAIYRRLWDALNAKRGYSWESNPWVWALSFRVLR